MSGWLDKFDKEDYYLSPEGFIVFTEKYHLKRGYCCQSGCKHCPYGFNKGRKKNTDEHGDNPAK
jgi:hypothetical protein